MSAALQDPTRRAELAAIHVAAKQLAIAEDSYRSLVARFTGARTESAGEMRPSERRALIEHFRGLGFKAAKKGRQTRAPAPRQRREVAKLRALWLALWNLGVIYDASDKALSAFLKRHSGLDALSWADGEQLDVAIDCLRGWCQRFDYEAKPFKALVDTPQQGSFRPGLIHAQWQRLQQLGALKHGAAARLDTWLYRMGYRVAAPQFLSHEAADDAIATLGRWIRREAFQGAEGGNDGGIA